MTLKRYNKSLFLFRRDLRLEDNTGLIDACKHSEQVIPAFFFYNDLLNPSGEKFRPNLIEFMYHSLLDLSEQLEKKSSSLNVFFGKSFFYEFEKVLRENEIEAVFVNEDYTPYSKRRDNGLINICKKYNIDFHSSFDYLLARPGDVLTKEGRPYRVFTPFFRAATTREIKKPEKNSFRNFLNLESKKDLTPLKMLLKPNNNLAQTGGRKEALKRIKVVERLSNYGEIRDFPALDGTTCLSAHIKFGTISVRELFWHVKRQLGPQSQLITELFWRDFYSHLTYFFPHVFKHSFNKKYENIKLENDEKIFIAWCNGETGFPIVDAGMRQMNSTGWMHNRVRMIVASFLTKDLHIDWRWGEKYFSSMLVDYDPSSNNGGWQWAASTGADSQPYFRIFNPWRQQERFDPDAVYIKKWIPELRDFPAVDIHNPEKGSLFSPKYPSPIVSHKIEADKSKKIYKEI